MSQIYRHGDVGSIAPIDAIPESATPIKIKGDSFVLKNGTETGHSHLLTADGLQMFEDTEGRRYFTSSGDASLTHEEHKPLTIPAGTYIVNYEREMDHFSHTVREVID